MKKRGVSPLIATVILVAIVIIIALLLWFWYNQFLEEQRAKAQTELTQECAQNTELQVRSASCIDTSGNYTITIDLSNTGSSKITSFTFSIESLESSVSKEVGRILEAGTALDFTLQVDSTELTGVPAEVKIIPIVSKGSSAKHCDGQAAYATVAC
jgi:flagellin-like protein